MVCQYLVPYTLTKTQVATSPEVTKRGNVKYLSLNYVECIIDLECLEVTKWVYVESINLWILSIHPGKDVIWSQCLPGFSSFWQHLYEQLAGPSYAYLATQWTKIQCAGQLNGALQAGDFFKVQGAWSGGKHNLWKQGVGHHTYPLQHRPSWHGGQVHCNREFWCQLCCLFLGWWVV